MITLLFRLAVAVAFRLGRSLALPVRLGRSLALPIRLGRSLPIRLGRSLALAILIAGLAAAAAAPDAHLKSNSLYDSLLHKGIAVSATQYVPLPPPLMADGRDATAQKTLIKKLLGDDIDYDGFMEDTVTAPYLLLPLREVKGGTADAPVRALEFYFVAYGRLKTLTNKEVLDRLGGMERNKGEGKTLTAEDLAKRGITIPSDMAKREGFGHGTFNLLDKVQLQVTGQSIWSETTDSLTLAAAVDPRFNNDKEFPNQWRSLEKNDEGDFKKGPPHPYQGAGYYLKVTRLKDPDTALFLECHVYFAEPAAWFQGTNLLRSKLPPVTQDVVRKVRRELKKAE